MKKIKTIILTFIFLFSPVWASENNNSNSSLRNLFINKKAVIYAINIRSFGAKDLNGDEIVDTDYEEKGTFLNAAERLDELKRLGINTIYLLPITKTGKLKALGTAGSLYSMDSFNRINPQFDDTNNQLDIKDEAKFFMDEAHKKGFKVMVDLPSCGSYDMTLEKPELFLKNKDNSAITPSDWTDVRLFKTLERDGKLNDALMQEYKSFIDLAIELNADGIRADVAGIKPKEFWLEIIKYTREKNPEMFFLAEASNSWSNPIKPYSDYLSVNELLQTGFDGYYGEYMNFLGYKDGREFIKTLEREKKILKKFDNKKATMATFATHDQTSPNINGDGIYSKMIIWLSTTLPTNTYYLDGFPTGDRYIYGYENKKANKSSTDDDYLFVHRGKFDIFNFSRRPGGENSEIRDEILASNRFRIWAGDILSYGSLKFIKTGNKNVVAFERKYKKDKVIVIFNMDQKSPNSAKIHIPQLKKANNFTPIREAKNYTVENNNIIFNLSNGEIAVFIFSQN